MKKALFSLICFVILCCPVLAEDFPDRFPELTEAQKRQLEKQRLEAAANLKECKEQLDNGVLTILRRHMPPDDAFMVHLLPDTSLPGWHHCEKAKPLVLMSLKLILLNYFGVIQREGIEHEWFVEMRYRQCHDFKGTRDLIWLKDETLHVCVPYGLSGWYRDLGKTLRLRYVISLRKALIK